MQQLITWGDLFAVLNRMPANQLQQSLCINVAVPHEEGEFYGVSDDGTFPKILFSPDSPQGPLDEDEPYLRLEI